MVKTNFIIKNSPIDCNNYNLLHDMETVRRDKSGSYECCVRCKTIVFMNKGVNGEFNNKHYAKLHELDFAPVDFFKQEQERSLNK